MGASNFYFNDSIIGETQMAYLDMSEYVPDDYIYPPYEMHADIREIFKHCDVLKSWKEEERLESHNGDSMYTILESPCGDFCIGVGIYQYNTNDSIPVGIIVRQKEDELSEKELEILEAKYKHRCVKFYDCIANNAIGYRYGGPHTKGKQIK